MAYSHGKHWLRRTTILLPRVICVVEGLRRLGQPGARGGPGLAGGVRPPAAPLGHETKIVPDNTQP